MSHCCFSRKLESRAGAAQGQVGFREHGSPLEASDVTGIETLDGFKHILYCSKVNCPVSETVIVTLEVYFYNPSYY